MNTLSTQKICIFERLNKIILEREREQVKLWEKNVLLFQQLKEKNRVQK